MTEISESLLPVASSIMTDSKADYIAQLCGSPSLAKMAGGMPHDAAILDVGAGRSDFAQGVAAERSDITAVAVDIQYGAKTGQLTDLRMNQPQNLSFVAAGAGYLPLASHSFDRIYSYNLMGHLMRQEPQIGRLALSELLRVAKPGGSLCLGPAYSRVLLKREMIYLNQGASPAKVDEALSKLNPPFHLKYVLNAMDASAVGTAPRRRFEPGKKGKVFMDLSNGEHHPLRSRKGFKLGLKLARHLLMQAL